MLPVPLRPDLFQYGMTFSTMWCSVLISPSLLFLAPLHATCAALRLSVSLLPDLYFSMPIHDTKSCPDNTDGLILDSEIMDEHVWGWDTLPYHYKSYFLTPLATILHTSIMAPKQWYRLINTAQETTITDKYKPFFSSKALHTWLGIQ